MLKLLERANSFYCPSGKWSFKGWLLLPRSEYNQLDKYSTTLQLNINDTTKQDNVGTLKNLSIVQAQCATRGLESDDNALYLIELTDGRGILYNQWFHFPINAQYNIRAPAYPNTFYLASLNSGTTWTWETMLQNIWEMMGTFLGSWPGFPSGYSANGTPEGFWFNGVSAWCALCNILDYLGLIVACDLTSSSPYTIVEQSAADSSFAALTTKYAKFLEEDSEWIDLGSARVPKTVTVYFRRRNEIYGTEETVRYDSNQWTSSPIYSVSINAPANFSSAVGTHYIWSDFTVRYDQNNLPLIADTTTAATIAQERVTQYYNKIYGNSTSRTYAGALPFTTGSLVDGVCWSHGYEQEDRRSWQTQIVYGPQPPWPDLWDEYK